MFRTLLWRYSSRLQTMAGGITPRLLCSPNLFSMSAKHLKVHLSRRTCEITQTSPIPVLMSSMELPLSFCSAHENAPSTPSHSNHSLSLPTLLDETRNKKEKKAYSYYCLHLELAPGLWSVSLCLLVRLFMLSCDQRQHQCK